MSNIDRETEQDVIICRCEDISRGEIEEAIAAGARTLSEVKWRTRAGMGLCQGKTCRRLIAFIIAQRTGIPFPEVAISTHRAPVRPTPLGAIAAETEGNVENR